MLTEVEAREAEEMASSEELVEAVLVEVEPAVAAMVVAVLAVAAPGAGAMGEVVWVAVELEAVGEAAAAQAAAGRVLEEAGGAAWEVAEKEAVALAAGETAGEALGVEATVPAARARAAVTAEGVELAGECLGWLVAMKVAVDMVEVGLVSVATEAAALVEVARAEVA